MNTFDLKPAQLLSEYWTLFLEPSLPGPILDLACGDGQNGVFLDQKGLPVICCDKSTQALERTKQLASHYGVTVTLWQVDMEREGLNPLAEDFYRGILVFRYLHRPLMPCITKALEQGGLLIYETFTVDQPKFGEPRNPNFLLQPGELKSWFADWEIIHSFEGITYDPPRAVAQLVGRKPISWEQI